VLLSAVELELFTRLGDQALTAAELRGALGLHERAVPDFTDALVALKVLARDGAGAEARYRNTPESALFLDKRSPAYIGGILEMAGARLYTFWGHLTEALRTGKPQNEIKKHGRVDVREALRAAGAARPVHERHGGDLGGELQGPRREVRLLEVRDALRRGRSDGAALVQRRRAHPHMRCTSFDLASVEPIARRWIERAGLSDRVATAAGDFFADPLPRADVITMGMILHDWNLERKMHLVRAAYDALPPGGAFIRGRGPHRRRPARERLRPPHVAQHAHRVRRRVRLHRRRLRPLVHGGRFKRVEVLPLAGPSSAAIAYK